MNDDLYYLNRFTGTDIVIDESDTGVVEKLNFTCASTQVSKNLLDDTAFSTQTVSGVTFTKNSDGTILANGTATAGISLTLSNFVYFTLPAGSYIISDGVSGTAATYFTYIDPIDIATYNAGTFTLANATSIRARIVVRTGITLNNVLFKPQIEIGSTATSYVSYNPTPDYPITIYSSGDGGYVNVWSHKKNICFTDVSEWESGQYNSTAPGGKIANINRVRLKELVRVESSTTYYCNSNFASTPSIGFIIRRYDGLGVFVSNIGFIYTNNTFTTPATCKYISVSLADSSGTSYTSAQYLAWIADGTVKPFICLNTETNKAYEPYTGSTTDITLPTGYIGGSLPNGVADTDTQKKIGKVVLNGSETWYSNQGDSTNTRFHCIALSSRPKTTNVGLSNYFLVRAESFKLGISFYTNDNAIYIWVLNTTAATINDFKTWLSTHNVTVYYELATPIDITITKPQIPTYEGINTITTTNNIKPTMTIEAWKR